MRPFEKAQCLLFIVMLFVCLASTSVIAADLPDTIGEVVSVIGTVTATQPDGDMRTLVLESRVVAKDVICTGCKSSVEIVFKDKSVLSQGPSARTSLDEFVYSDTASASKILLKLGAGTLRYVTGEVVKQNPDAFSLATPSTVVGIRGTEVFVEISQKQEEIGVFSMTPGHVVEISTQKEQKTIERVGLSVKTTPDGGLSNPEATDPQTRDRVIQAAPQTTQGEISGTPASKIELERMIDAFAGAINRSKGALGGIGDRPDYGGLHTVSLQKSARRSTESECSMNSEASEGESGVTDDNHGDY